MKNIIKRLMCVSMALIILCFGSIVSFVSADLSVFTDAQLLSYGWHFSSHIDNTYLDNLKNYFFPLLQGNSSFNLSDFFVYSGYFDNSQYDRCGVMNKNSAFKFETSDAYYFSSCDVKGTIFYPCAFLSGLSYTNSSTGAVADRIKSFDFSSCSQLSIANTASYVDVIKISKSKNYNDIGYMRAIRLSYSAFKNYNNIYDIKLLEDETATRFNVDYFLIPNTVTELPDNELKQKSYDLYGVNVNEVDKVGFLQWLQEFNKIEEIRDTGLNIANDKLTYLLDFWIKYKGRPLSMLANAPSLLWEINLTSITFDTITSFSSCLDNLYLQYQNYLSERNSAEKVGILNPANLPHHQRSISDTSLITDDVSDTTDISLLRDILRQIILLPDEISNNFGYLSVYLDGILVDFDRLLYYLDSLPDYVAYNIHILFSDDIQTIIDAINNISVSVPEGDTTTNNFIDVTIPDEKQTELNNFFNGWNTRFSDELNSKFPIKSQLENLFTDFFEKCGVDTNSDGQVFEYVTYNSDLNTVNSDGGFSVRHDNDIKSTLLSCFDDADTSYLDNIVYSDDIPKLGIKINGVQHEIINFKFYAKYRQYIFAIISFILWFGYLYSLYKSLPAIVGRVSGVVSAFKTSDVTKGDDD